MPLRLCILVGLVAAALPLAACSSGQSESDGTGRIVFEPTPLNLNGEDDDDEDDDPETPVNESAYGYRSIRTGEDDDPETPWREDLKPRRERPRQ